MYVDDVIRQFIVNDLAPESGLRELGEETPLIGDGLLDSMRIMVLLAFLEQKFDIKVGDEELLPENFETLAAVTRLVQRKLAPV